MTATLTIVLDGAALSALKSSNSITIGVGGTTRVGASPTPAQADRGKRPGGGNGGFREGSLPAKLTKWAKGRKRGFGVPDVMKALKIKRAHASMVLTKVIEAGAIRRAERGVYQA